MSILDPLYRAVAGTIVGIHSVVEKIPGFGDVVRPDGVLRSSGYAWALSIMLMTVAVRILIFPLAVKQLKSMRAMAAMQPAMQEIQEKFKHDKEAKAQAQMQLMKERGNPLLGCLPVLLQFPVFVAVFRVLSSIVPTATVAAGMTTYAYTASHGLTSTTIERIATADFFGTSLAASALDGDGVLSRLGTTGGVSTTVSVVLLALSSVVTFLSMRSSMKRGGTEMPAQQAQVQKLLLYGSPVAVFVFGLNVPIGVAVYWVTNNLWTFGQQTWLLHKYPLPEKETTSAERAAKVEAARSGDTVDLGKKKAAPKSLPPSRPTVKQVRVDATDDATDDAPGDTGPSDAMPVGAGAGSSPGQGGRNRPGNNRPGQNKRRAKGSRPGGRR